ncbi:UvrB/UvrC motif-containing protein [Candidatus Sumerlaeota bacterium]|nr:UvrB/UvrC motif-containing protein [Candidatus Sumerlaeota bacterium]
MALHGHRLCDICNKARATIKYTRIDGDQVREMLICQACASEHSPLHRHSEAEVGGLQKLFSTLLKEKGASELAAKVEPTECCSVCGTPFETYRKTFLLGCPGCYESFADALTIDLRKIHGAITHRGKVPEGQAEEIEQRETIVGMKRQLAEAVEREDFEAAAHLRDRIRDMEREEETPPETP